MLVWEESYVNNQEKPIVLIVNNGSIGSLGRLFSFKLLFKDMDKFARWLQTFEKSSHIQLEPWFLILRLPRLLRPQAGIITHTQTDNVDRLLGSLLSKLSLFGVKKVWRLEVEDDIHDPTSDTLICTFVRSLSIEQLDWQKPDLDIDLLLSKSKTVESLREISLYSSNIGSLINWSGEEGLIKFSKVRLLRSLQWRYSNGPFS